MEFLADNWIYLVLISFLVYRMFKGGGCCGGHSESTQSNKGHFHGGCCSGSFVDRKKDDYNPEINPLNSVKDPICGMTINPNTALNLTIDGKTYYFCSESCKDVFVRKQNLLEDENKRY